MVYIMVKKIISDLPTVTITAPSNTIGNTDVVIQCSVTPMAGLLEVAWEFTTTGGSATNLSILTDSHYDGGTTGNPDLTIKTATNADDGNYTCYARNADGSARSGTVSVDILSMSILFMPLA